jgi:hypothetical protein
MALRMRSGLARICKKGAALKSAHGAINRCRVGIIVSIRNQRQTIAK